MPSQLLPQEEPELPIYSVIAIEVILGGDVL
jgi:hypothetical protein